MDVRQNAALCLESLVRANKSSCEVALKGGAVEALLTLLDDDGEREGGATSETAYLAIMAMQSLGFATQPAQEKACKAHTSAAEAVVAARLHSLKSAWSLEHEPREWK